MNQCPAQSLTERLAEVKLSARSDLKVSRHLFRGEPSYVVHDSVRFASHRLAPREYRILANLDGEKTLAENFQHLIASDQVNVDDESDFYDFIVRLQMMGLLSLPLTNTQALYERYLEQKEALRGSLIGKLFFYKIPLCNPDAMLDRTIKFMKFFFSRAFFVIWLILGTLAAGIIFLRFGEFTAPLGTFLATENLLVLWVTLILLKVWHELGHGWACKKFGGSVPDMGALFFAMTPCAYVDASSAWNFTRTRDRIIVSLGGMYFESIAAILATFVWAFSTDPFVRSCAQQVIVLSTVTTLLFNANPLMRYDGYYVLVDLLGLPNLRAHSVTEMNSLAKRTCLGINAPTPTKSTTTRLILLAYGFCSSIYKSTIMIGIAMVIAYRIPKVGLLIGGYYVATLVIGLSYKLCKYLLFDDETAPVRMRARIVCGLVMLGIPALMMALPISTSTRVDGVVGAEKEQWVRIESGGYLKDAHVAPGQHVAANQPLYTFSNDELLDQWRSSEAEVKLARQKWLGRRAVDNSAAVQALVELAALEQKSKLASQRLSALRPKATFEGTVTTCISHRGPGDYFQVGEPLAVVVAGKRVIRALLSTEQLTGTMPELGSRIACRLRADRAKRQVGTVTNVAPVGAKEIEHAVLTQEGAGSIVVDPNSNKAQRSYFEITIQLDHDFPDGVAFGSSAVVTIPQRYESIGGYIYRKFKMFYDNLVMG